MENETTLPGLLTVPGELLHQPPARGVKKRVLWIGIALALGGALAMAWLAWY